MPNYGMWHGSFIDVGTTNTTTHALWPTTFTISSSVSSVDLFVTPVGARKKRVNGGWWVRNPDDVWRLRRDR